MTPPPPPNERYMERGHSFRQASILTNEVYRGLVEGRSYDACLGRAYTRSDFGKLGDR